MTVGYFILKKSKGNVFLKVLLNRAPLKAAPYNLEDFQRKALMINIQRIDTYSSLITQMKTTCHLTFTEIVIYSQ